MNTSSKAKLGRITLSYQENTESDPVSVVMPESNKHTFMLVAHEAYSLAEREAKSSHIASLDNNAITSPAVLSYAKLELGVNDREKVSSSKPEDNIEQKAEKMTGINREELQAHLDKNKAEVEALASGLRKDMAEWSQKNTEQLSQLTISINSLSSKIDGKIEATNGKLDGMQGHISGINSAISGVNIAISGIQSGLSTKLTIFGVIITVVIALVGFSSALLPNNSVKLEHKESQTAPIVIQIPPNVSLSPQPIIPPSKP